LVTDREKFCALLSSGPLLRGEAIVVLCGEDAVPRYQTALQLLKQDAADYVVLSGGLSNPPSHLGAYEVEAALVGLGLSPKKIILEPNSFNTREQAVNVIKLAKEKGWKRLLIVASSYHIYRAFLTFLKALQEDESALDIQLVPVPVVAAWGQRPDGVKGQRHKLLDLELEKIEEYSHHVADYKQGISYLLHWEKAA